MTSYQARVVLEGRGFLEAPHWHDGRLWISDLHRHEVILVDPGAADGPAASVRVAATLDDQPSGLGFLPDGSAIVVSLLNRRVMKIPASAGSADRAADAELTVHADLSGLTVGGTNDMIVAPSGNAYVGSFGYDVFARAPKALANLVLVTPDGSARVVADELAFPNGMAFTSGGSLLVAESEACRISEFDVAPDGSLSGRRVYAELPGRPDGVAIDAEDGLWVSFPREGRFDRLRPGGEVSDTIAIRPGWRAVSCGFGDDDLRSLYLATAKVVEPTSEAAIEVARVDVAAPAAR